MYEDLPDAFWNAINVKVIFSLKKGKTRNPVEKWKNYLWRKEVKQKWNLAFPNSSFELIGVKDINHPNFYKNIGKDSLGICTGFDQIFSLKLLDRFQECLNFHPSILPYYRGPAPSYWCIYNEENYSGYTLHRMTEKIDQGEILFQEKTPILSSYTEQDLDTVIAIMAKDTLMNYLKCSITGVNFPIKEIPEDQVYKVKKAYYSFPKE